VTNFLPISKVNIFSMTFLTLLVFKDQPERLKNIKFHYNYIPRIIIYNFSNLRLKHLINHKRQKMFSGNLLFFFPSHSVPCSKDLSSIKVSISDKNHLAPNHSHKHAHTLSHRHRHTLTHTLTHTFTRNF